MADLEARKAELMAAVAADTETEDQVDAPEPDTPAEPEPIPQESVEQAKRLGWRPRDQYTNPPNGWVDADRFLELPSTQVKILRDEIRDRDRRFQALQRAQEATYDAIKRSEAEAYEMKLAQISAARKAAVEAGDVEEFNRVEGIAAKIKPPAPRVNAEAPAEEMPDWAKDPVLLQAAIRVIDANPAITTQGVTMKQQIDYAESKLRDAFPDRFPAKSDQPHTVGNQFSRVDPGTRGASSPIGRRTATTIAELPSADREDARRAFDLAKRYKKDYKEADYVKAYLGQA